MNITIFHQDIKITLTDDINLLPVLASAAVYTVENVEDFDLFDLLTNDDAKHIVIYRETVEALLLQIKQEFKVIQAAGGVVFNAAGQVLMMKRLEKWDLPKGKVEKNEQIEIAALREIQEETGLSQLQLIDFCSITYHTYSFKNQLVLKETYWYFVKLTSGNEALVPQIDEGITELKWVNLAEFEEIKTNTYENIITVLDQYLLLERK